MPLPTRTAVPRGRAGACSPIRKTRRPGAAGVDAEKAAHFLLFDLPSVEGAEAQPVSAAELSRLGGELGGAEVVAGSVADVARPDDGLGERLGLARRPARAAARSGRAAGRTATARRRPFGARSPTCTGRTRSPRARAGEGARGSRPRTRRRRTRARAAARAAPGRRGRARRIAAAPAGRRRRRGPEAAERPRPGARARRDDLLLLAAEPRGRGRPRGAPARRRAERPGSGSADSCRKATRTAEAPRGGESVRSNSHGACYDNRAARLC